MMYLADHALLFIAVRALFCVLRVAKLFRRWGSRIPSEISVNSPGINDTDVVVWPSPRGMTRINPSSNKIQSHKNGDEKAHSWLLTARNLAIVVGHIHIISLSVIPLFEGLTSIQGFGTIDREGLIDVGTDEDHTVILIVLFVLVL